MVTEEQGEDYKQKGYFKHSFLGGLLTSACSDARGEGNLPNIKGGDMQRLT